MGSKKSQTIGFRIKESLKDTIGSIAERETRTVSLQVEHFVRQGIREYLRNHPEFDAEQKANNSSHSSEGKQ